MRSRLGWFVLGAGNSFDREEFPHGRGSLVDSLLPERSVRLEQLIEISLRLFVFAHEQKDYSMFYHEVAVPRIKVNRLLDVGECRRKSLIVCWSISTTNPLKSFLGGASGCDLAVFGEGFGSGRAVGSVSYHLIK